MTTPRDIINLALLDAGVIGAGQTPNAEDMNNSFTRLNRMLAEWQRQRWLVYQLVDLPLTTTGALYYTVGPGGAFNTGSNPRPERLEAAFLRQLVQSQPNQVDYPLKLIYSYEDYSLIGLKQLQSFPEWAFYDSGYPLAKLYPWPVPQASIYALHLIIKQTLQRFTNLSDTVILPEEYQSALQYNLAVRLMSAYKQPPDPVVIGLAKSTLATVRGANAQISTLRMPQEVVRPGIYNIYSDRNC